MDVDTRRLRVFLAVADTLHFGRAAERLHVAQPSVSQHVARLETQLGQRLFVRAPSGVSLTHAGRELARLIGPAISDLDARIDAFLAAQGRAPLRIGALSSLASSLVPRAAAGITDVKLEIVEGSLSSLAQRLAAGQLDVVFCYDTAGPVHLEGLTVTVLDTRPVLFALPSDSRWAEEAAVPWDVAAQQPWILPSASRQYGSDMLERFTRRGHSVHVVAEATTMTGQHALVAAGIGWTFTSPWAPHPPTITVRPPASPDTLTLVALTASGDARPGISSLIGNVARHARTSTAAGA